jgi:predicted Zn-dependent protease
LCALRTRRRFTALLAATAAGVVQAQSGPSAEPIGVQGDVGPPSRFASFVPAEQVESGAARQYLQLRREAAGQHALAAAEHPQVQRLRAIADRIVPFAPSWNRRSTQWRWEVNLLLSPQLNAFCMPGGKIAFYYGILSKLRLSDDEVATVMGHEVAHALREHVRARMGKEVATQTGAGLLSALLGVGRLGDAVINAGAQAFLLKFSRQDETEADIVGLDLAARAGYDPAAGISLWQKMLASSQGAPPQWLSTHPSGTTRIRDIESKLPKVRPLYAEAAKPVRRYGPPEG